MNAPKQSNFDAAAENYDASFTHSSIGKFQRTRVYHWLNKIDFFKDRKKVFEINCGTGYDGIQFAKKGHQMICTDASATMIAVAKRHKESSVKFYQLSFDQLKADEEVKSSEVIFSNFGGLNCLSENSLAQFIAELSSLQKQSNLFIGVFMGKHCFMEDVYHLLKFDFGRIGRRNSKQGLVVEVNGEQIQTYYHGPKQVKKLLSHGYKIRLLKPVAFFLPPSYLEPFFKKYQFALRILNTLEQLFGRISQLAGFADHYIVIAEKK